VAAGRASAGATPGRGPPPAAWRGAAVRWPPSPCRGAVHCSRFCGCGRPPEQVTSILEVHTSRTGGTEGSQGQNRFERRLHLRLMEGGAPGTIAASGKVTPLLTIQGRFGSLNARSSLVGRGDTTLSDGSQSGIGIRVSDHVMVIVTARI
jgi:hypothetical protein